MARKPTNFPNGVDITNGLFVDGQAITPSGSSRTVIVSSADDLPAPSGGVHTLDSTKEYLLDADISLTNSVDLNDSLIFANKRSGASLTYTPTSGSLFVGAEGGEIRNIGATAPNGSSSIFNINNVGDDKVLNVISCFNFGSTSMGTVQGLSGFRMERCFNIVNTTGLTVQDISGLAEITRNIFGDTVTGTQINFVGDFTRIIVSDGIHTVASGQIGIDITNVTSVEDGVIDGGAYEGAGTHLQGVDANGHAPVAWSVEARGLVTSKDSVSGGEIYIDTSSETTISGSNTPAKAAGTTATKATSLFRFDDDGGTNNRLRYVGTEKIDMPVYASVSMTSASNNQSVSAYIAKNGVVDATTEIRARLATGSDETAIPIIGNIQFETNDYVEVWIENRTSSGNLTLTSMTLAVR